jgi:hypothetical protein
MKALWKWNSNEIVSQYTKMVFVAHLKYKMRFTYRNFKFKIPLSCTDGTKIKSFAFSKYTCFLLLGMLQFNTWMWEMSWENEFKNNTAIEDR